MKYIHRATVWRRTGLDPVGKPQFTRMGVLDVRWEDRVTVTIGGDGRQTRSRATVYLQVPVSEGDLIARGEWGDSTPPPEATEIRAYREIANLRGTRVERRAQL